MFIKLSFVWSIRDIIPSDNASIMVMALIRLLRTVVLTPILQGLLRPSEKNVYLFSFTESEPENLISWKAAMSTCSLSSFMSAKVVFLMHILYKIRVSVSTASTF